MLRLSVTMPPPKFGKGSAFKKPGLSETARGLAAATAHSASILSLEDYNTFEQRLTPPLPPQQFLFLHFAYGASLFIARLPWYCTCN